MEPYIDDLPSYMFMAEYDDEHGWHVMRHNLDDPIDSVLQAAGFDEARAHFVAQKMVLRRNCWRIDDHKTPPSYATCVDCGQIVNVCSDTGKLDYEYFCTDPHCKNFDGTSKGDQDDLPEWIHVPGQPTPEPRTETRHNLKCWPKYFMAVIGGHKLHEIRKNDRDFRAGDEILLQEWDPETQQYTGNDCLVRVSYLTAPGEWGLPDDIVIMSVKLQQWSLDNMDAVADHE